MLALVNTPKGQAPVELLEVDEPTATANETIIAVQAFSLNRGELSLLANRPEGWRPGQDIAGIVVKSAADGSGLQEGTHVVALVEQAGWAQRVAVPTSRLALLPETVSFASAATLPMAGLTALRTLRFGDPLQGKRVLITGAAGGVGRFLIQLAASAGAKVTGVVGSPERATGLDTLGATATITAIQQADGLFELILETVGGASLNAALDLVAPNGTIVLVGNSSGEKTPISLFNFFGHEGARLQSFMSYASFTAEAIGSDLAQLVSLIDAGKLTPQIGLEESWRHLANATRALRNRQVAGKAIFHID